jgi:hypothetical protein
MDCAERWNSSLGRWSPISAAALAVVEAAEAARTRDPGRHAAFQPDGWSARADRSDLGRPSCPDSDTCETTLSRHFSL